MSRLRRLWQKICNVHRGEDRSARGAVRSFFLPKLTRGFLLRMAVVALLTFVLFDFVLMPCVIDGASMVPTFPESGFTLCWKGKYLFSEPKRGDVVILRYKDRRYYLKRIVALPGETVEFRGGKLYVDGKMLDEPYVKNPCSWEMSPREVAPRHYYVIGDNRNQHIRAHRFGQVMDKKVVGAPLW